MTKVGVIGAGKWGEALSFAMGEKNDVIITSRTPRQMSNFRPLCEVLERPYLIVTVPAQQVAQWLKEHFVYSGQKVLVAAKGIEASSGRFLNEIYSEYVPEENLAFLSGPSFASEVLRKLPTALVVNSRSPQTADAFASLFPGFIRTYTSDDVIGAEVAGAYKNVIAIAAGICEGLGLGHNAAASLIARGLVEMERFGRAYGAREESFLGLSGAGDLFLTASSPMSRNYRVGLGLAEGKSKEAVCAAIGEVSEGIGTAYALHEIALSRGIYLPIAGEVYAILEGKSPRQSLKDLIER
ncbi:NAD(P)H-dependent glycerol-3-phosphate dehydrogenase [Sulfuricurvum sp. IAE1]|jgi:glycerol-3-phosphate dehydrogenase (NAD(P)+)|uniref:NAD(P)H-dependent glycerol-3-phosphate dehydrogenase n=1 Tax=Sulfuricurvum sp. IAE1 TaxID=2546102 RepID=UPI0010433104|nr:NAD(P)H-dependent glycerol-3-phosphate dehydrogenase [Sulfuricurvum sp. IAE1]MDD3770028.1 NAD(P)H-dependent glycerol-3-phosphate dehydrogenase [Sulfuricurvum sp.]MDX9965712.1 NAD(P)H-dependent glycerol-3-phosphate dehydrogenase [Sulfuricurvum sp.]TDA69132.1 NAD(P)H-dependent glycerol-3-phosphate dehydrogenase [Sulfuricurvum sp. IAE1]